MKKNFGKCLSVVLVSILMGVPAFSQYFPEKEDNIMYMPFWRIWAEISGITLQSYADLVKIANLPIAVQKNWDNIQFRFWTLAFKLRPLNFVNLARNITISQPQENFS